MNTQEKIESISLNGKEYVLASSVRGNLPDELDGLKYAIVRSRNQGVMTGYVKSRKGQVVELVKSRQIWRYDSKFVLSDMAEFGVRNADECKFSCEMSQDMVMLEACGILYCTDIAGDSIRGVKAQEK